MDPVLAADTQLRLHPIVQHTDDLDDVRLHHAIKEHMRWVRHRLFATFVAAVPDMKAVERLTGSVATRRIPDAVEIGSGLGR